MKKKVIGVVMLVILVGGGLVWWKLFNNVEENEKSQVNTENYQVNKNNVKIDANSKKNISKPIVKEIEIANFSTKIYNKEVDRQNNIDITCKTLSMVEIQPGEIFSFCNIVGKATPEKGYKEADIYVEGKKEKGLGGGNCQVSTTLYNAVLQVAELEVIERHQHSGRVPYIEKGKDAAVAYGNYDFKFKNNTGNVIKIVMQHTVDNITAKLIKIQ